MPDERNPRRRRWVDLPLRAKGLVVVSIPLAALLLMGALVYSSQRQAESAERMVAHTLEVKAEIDHAQTLFVEAELGVRGYLVSRTAEALGGFHDARAAAPAAIERLAALVNDNPEQIERVRTLSVIARDNSLTSIVEYVDRMAAGAPAPLDLLQHSRVTMAGLRATLAEMQQAEDALLETRTHLARGARRRARVATAGGVGLGLAGGAVAAVLFTSGVARRIAEVTANARRLSAGEPLAPMPAALDELGVLAASLSAAADLLGERETALRQRMTELTAVNNELESFSYSVSHDLRAPLRHVAGFATLLQKRAGPALDAEAVRHLRTIVDAAGQMGRLVDDLLAFSRMGRTEMIHEEVDLNAMMRDVVREAAADVGGRRINWRTHPLPPVAGHPAMLRLALAHLVSNAVKYTAPREVAEIEIGTLTSGNGERIVYVRDNGVGFDMTYVDKLFGVFQRLHAADQFEGTGIGLASVRRIVERHGGRAWAQGAMDRGATFFVSLPAAGTS